MLIEGKPDQEMVPNKFKRVKYCNPWQNAFGSGRSGFRVIEIPIFISIQEVELKHMVTCPLDHEGMPWRTNNFLDNHLNMYIIWICIIYIIYLYQYPYLVQDFVHQHVVDINTRLFSLMKSYEMLCFRNWHEGFRQFGGWDYDGWMFLITCGAAIHHGFLAGNPWTAEMSRLGIHDYWNAEVFVCPLSLYHVRLVRPNKFGTWLNLSRLLQPTSDQVENT